MKILLLFIILSNFNFGFSQNTLTLFNTPSPLVLDWTTPTSLAKDAAKNYLAAKILPFIYHRRYIGHVNVELICEEKRLFTGMTAIKMNALKELWNGRGFGILYHSFEGKLEDESTWNEIQTLLDRKISNFVQFDISQKTCQKLTTYFQEYKKYNIEDHYGLVHRPLYGEGAGCSAFAISFLEVAGLMKEEYKDKWSNIVNVPLIYSGAPLTKKKISLFSLFTQNISWAKEPEGLKTLLYWSPDLIHQWVNNKVKSYHENKNLYSLKKIKNSKGIVINATHIESTHPTWKEQFNNVHLPDLTKEKNF